MSETLWAVTQRQGWSARFPCGDWAVAAFVTLAVHALGVALATRADRISPPHAASSPPAPSASTIDVQMDDSLLPLLAFGSEHPVVLPDMAPRPTPVRRSASPRTARHPSSSPHRASPLAEADPAPLAPSAPSSAPSTAASSEPTKPSADADETPSTPEGAKIARADPSAAAASEAPPATTTRGAADGAKSGTETDPLKAQQLNIYRAELDAWFSSRFPIRGKVPWETLRTLRAIVDVHIESDRRVGSFVMTTPSGDSAFDETLRRALAACEGAVLPAPPATTPEALGTTLHLVFRCTVRSYCE